MNSKRPTVESLSQRTLFDLQRVSEPASRPFSLPGMLLGTSSFTAAGWQGSFYPIGMRSKDFLSYYAGQFQTVEIDSTFYGTPTASTVTSWNEKTPQDFIIAAKVPQLCGDENYVAKRPEWKCFRIVLDFVGHITGLESEHRRHLTPNDGGSFKEVLGRRLSIPALLQPCRRLVPRLLLESRGRRHDPDKLEQNYTGDASKLQPHRR